MAKRNLGARRAKVAVSAALRLVAGSPVGHLLRRASEAGRVPRPVWRRLPHPHHPFRVRVSNRESFQYQGVRGDNLGRPMFWIGAEGGEPETMPEFLALAREASTIVDVGANTGTFTLSALASNRDVRVFAFEALPRVCERLRRNVALNDWQGRVQIFEAAAGAETGTVRFVDPARDVPTSARLVTAQYRVDADAQPTIEVPMMRLDEVPGLSETRVDVIKIDVEGAEDQVLKGAIGILERDRPDLVFECHPEGPCDEISDLLLDLGYKLFSLGPSGRRPTSRVAPTGGREFRNFLATATE